MKDNMATTSKMTVVLTAYTRTDGYAAWPIANILAIGDIESDTVAEFKYLGKAEIETNVQEPIPGQYQYYNMIFGEDVVRFAIVVRPQKNWPSLALEKVES